VVLRDARPGEVFDVEASGDGTFILRRLEPVQNHPTNARLEKRGKYTVIVTEKPVDMKVVKELLADFP